MYEITNLINGKKYIGKRACKCDIEEDVYMGSSKVLKEAIRKYGVCNFKKDIIFICKDENEAYEKEEEYITLKNAVNDRNYYNLCGGGKGAGSGKNNPRFGKKLSKKHIDILINSNKNRKISDETRAKFSKNRKGKFLGENNPFYGKKHTEETKLKISIASSNRTLSEETKVKISNSLKGEKSPMYNVPKTDSIKEKISISRKGKLVGGDNPWSKKVICITTGEIFNSISQASRKYNVGVPKITACCKGRRKSAGKMEWKYYEGSNV